MSGLREIHAHFVYGVDDGPSTKAEMEAMLDAAHAQGITLLIATPHVTPGVYRFDEERFRRHLDEAKDYCLRKGYDIQLYAGAEIMYSPAGERCIKDGMIPTLGDSPYVLIEFVPDVSFDELRHAASAAERAGYKPILAHIERYDCLHRKDHAYRLKKESHVLYQVNCNTLMESRGFFADRRIRKWFKDGLIDFVASDAHDLKRRPFRMKDAYDILCERFGEDYADLLAAER